MQAPPFVSISVHKKRRTAVQGNADAFFHIVLLAKGAVQFAALACHGLLCFLIGTGLIGDGTARFASALARTLALAATAVRKRFTQAGL